MPNWLASEVCTAASLATGAWRTFKVLKEGDIDYNLLKTWCLLGLLQVFEVYLEFLVSWVPFYWLGKCLGLGLLFLPGGNVPTVLFERVVVRGMDEAHDILNDSVLPNAAAFLVSLPWRLLAVLFPSSPPLSAAGNTQARRSDGQVLRTALGSRLRHLRKTGRYGGAERHESHQRRGQLIAGQKCAASPPPLPARSPPSQLPRVEGNDLRDGEAGKILAASPTDAQKRERPSSAGRNVFTLVDGKLGAGVTVPLGTLGLSDVSDESGDGARDISELTSVSSAGATTAGSLVTPNPSAFVQAADQRSAPQDAATTGTRSPRRTSIGDIVRSAITGDSKVRVRDHLFDLNTASPPLPKTSTSRGVNGSAGSEPPNEPLRPLPQGEESWKQVAASPADKAVQYGVATRRRPAVYRDESFSSSDHDDSGECIAERQAAVKRKTRVEGDTTSQQPQSLSRLSRAGGIERSSIDDKGAVSSRAARLLEWRRKRAQDMASTSNRQGKKQTPTSTSKATIPAALKATSTASDAMRDSKATGVANTIPGGFGTRRRSRHVERLRSEMSVHAQGSKNLAGASTLATRSMRTGP